MSIDQMLYLIQNYWNSFLQGYLHTIQSSAIALVLSLILGTLMAIMLASEHKGLRLLASVYVEFFRNIPLLIIVMFFYVVVPLYWIHIDGFTAGTIGLTIYTSSFIADVVYSGITGIPKGQMEAGLSSGFKRSEVMRYIILPQAFRMIIPPLGNQLINLIKNSSILAMVAGLDIMYQGDLISMETFITFDTYIIVGLFYLSLTVPITWLINRYQQRILQKEVS